ncbi:replication protein A 70 kDa DNA-binding subunit C-like protein [Tanacetum coccineum]
MSNKAAENMSSEVAQSKTDLFLDDLVVGVTGTIVVMVCKIWDVNAVTGRYLSTDFVMCDAKGNVIHCTARANIAHNFIRKAYVKAGAFVRYPFQLQDIDNIEPRDNKYLIDVVGYVTNVGRTTQQRTRSRTLGFYLANGSSDIVQNKLYLSSSSLTQILDDPEITALKEFKGKISDNTVELHEVAMHVDHSEPKDGTMENLLIWARNRKNDVSLFTFHCEPNVMSGHEKPFTNTLSFQSSTFHCRVSPEKMEVSGVMHVTSQLNTRLRLELDDSDKTATAVVVMFDETATYLVKCSVESIAEVGDEAHL